MKTLFILFLFISSTAFAKCFVVKDKDALHVIDATGFTPQYSEVYDCPEAMPANTQGSDIDIIEEPNSDMPGEMIKRAIVNGARYSARLQASADAEKASKDAVAAEKVKREELKAQVKAFKEEIKAVKKIDELIPLTEKLINTLDEIAVRTL